MNKLKITSKVGVILSGQLLYSSYYYGGMRLVANPKRFHKHSTTKKWVFTIVKQFQTMVMVKNEICVLNTDIGNWLLRCVLAWISNEPYRIQNCRKIIDASVQWFQRTRFSSTTNPGNNPLRSGLKWCVNTSNVCTSAVKPIASVSAVSVTRISLLSYWKKSLLSLSGLVSRPLIFWDLLGSSSNTTLSPELIPMARERAALQFFRH